MSIKSINAAALEKIRTASTATAKAAAKVIQPHLESPKTAFEEMQDAVNAARAEYFKSVGSPTWTRSIASWVCSLLSGLAAYWYGMQLANVVLLALASFTGYGFITFVVAVLAIIAVLTASIGLGTLTYNFVQSVDVSAIKSRVTGWFKKPALVAPV